MHGDNQGDVREICTAGIDKYGKNWEVSLTCAATWGCLLPQQRRKSAQLTHLTNFLATGDRLAHGLKLLYLFTALL